MDVLSEEPALDAAREHRPHGCGNEALDLAWVGLDVFANGQSLGSPTAVRARTIRSIASSTGARSRPIGEAGSGVGERVRGQRVEERFPVGVVAVEGCAADAGRLRNIRHVRAAAVLGERTSGLKGSKIAIRPQAHGGGER